VGETHFVATDLDAAIFDLRGRETQIVQEQVVPGTTLSLGTDRPIRGPGSGPTFPIVAPLLETAGATVSTRQFLKLDTALLEATAPLLNLTAGSTFTTSADAIDLSFRAKVTSLGPVIALDRSSLTVNGALINVNGSVFSGSGSLLSLANGSTLNAQLLASILGGGQFNWAGPLATFLGSGNAINFNNSLCAANSCIAAGGLKFALQNGAVGSNITVTNPTPWVGLGAGGTVNLPADGAHFLVKGSESRVKLTP
jgi:hypothetical protein